MRLLLHACCGPCTLEPLRLLQEEGHDITIAYMNSNIHPQDEYIRRLNTLLDYAQSQGIPVIEGVYDPQAWAKTSGVYGANPQTRAQRCRACYRLRLDEACRYAAHHDFEGVATTLTVSPYQYTDIIREELEAACAPYGLTPVFRDFKDRYPEATRRSKELGMYRQNYCGCEFSKAEAEQEREERRAERARAKAEKAKAEAPKRAAEEAARAKKRAEREAYAKKRATQRAAVKAYKREHQDVSKTHKREHQDSSKPYRQGHDNLKTHGQEHQDASEMQRQEYQNTVAAHNVSDAKSALSANSAGNAFSANSTKSVFPAKSTKNVFPAKSTKNVFPAKSTKNEFPPSSTKSAFAASANQTTSDNASDAYKQKQESIVDAPAKG